MKSINYFLILFLLFSVSSCKLATGIFKAGFWVGIVLVVVIILAAFFIVQKLRKH